MFLTKEIEIVHSELATNAGSLASAPPAEVSLSLKEKRRIRLEIVNPSPNAEGQIHTSISLLHAERLFRNGRAYKDEAGRVVFVEVEAARVDMAERFAARRIGHVRGNPDLPIASFRGGPGQSAIDLWPVIPHVSGRPLDDFIETESRNRRGASAEKPWAVAPTTDRS